MSREEGVARVLVIGGGLAGLAAVEAALATGVPGAALCLVERGERLLAGWRAGRFPPPTGNVGPTPWLTSEGPLFAAPWLDALAAMAEEAGPAETVEREAAARLEQLREAGVTVRFGAKATEVVRDAEGNFRVWFEHGFPVAGRRLIIAAGGGNNHSFGWAEEWGLPLRPRVPAGLNLRLSGSRGKTWNQLEASEVEGTLHGVGGAEELRQRGTLDSAHPWIGGTVVSRLTLQSPAALAAAHHRGELSLDWLPREPRGLSPKVLARMVEQAGRRTLGEYPWEGVGLALWHYAIRAARIPPETLWRTLDMRQGQLLAHHLRSTRLRFDGFRLDREAGLSAGGVALEGLVPGTFEVRALPGLHWVGEGVDLHSLEPAANAAVAVAAGRAAGEAAAARI